MSKSSNFVKATRLSRRTVLKAAGAGAALAAAGLPTRLFAADPLKVAAVYTVPVEQQWVSRIHKAANAAKDRGDIEYVFRKTPPTTTIARHARILRGRPQADPRRGVGVEDAARAVARDYPTSPS